MNIVFAKESDKAAWNDFVKNNNGTVFHLFEWSEILNKTYGYLPAYIYASNDGMKGIIPAMVTKNPLRKRLISMPFLDYAGPLANENVSEKLVSYIINFCKTKNIDFELFSLNQISMLNNHHISDTFILDTTRHYDEIWEKYFDKKVRNMIRKATKSGVVVKRESSAFLDDYYLMYLETMKKLGRLPHSYDLFKNIQNYLGDNVELYSARCDGTIIGGLLTFRFNGRMHIWGNVSKEEYLKYAPNNALYNFVIKSACEDELDCVDFGSTPFNSGHYKFKKEWGGLSHPIYLATFKSEIKKGYGRSGLQDLIVKSTPTKLLGKLAQFAFGYMY